MVESLLISHCITTPTWNGLLSLPTRVAGLAFSSAVYNVAVQKYLCIGYDCVCGERVEVLRWPRSADSFPPIPAAITVCCRRGHVATITAEVMALRAHSIGNDRRVADISLPGAVWETDIVAPLAAKGVLRKVEGVAGTQGAAA